ncbi:hypothetical protein KIW84_030812 [Lathyrus oleraceus]|uniref:Selenoprotein O n=2 Tax=Pisum sativum TaxID=3888 RepID=A0A9D5AUG3_PEA|nr:hypothetical protein KIW84_030812 [Pisum sativum]
MLKQLVVALVKGLNSSPPAIIKKITDFGVSAIMEDYAIKHHFPHVENMSKNESLSFSTGDEDVVDLTSNKYAAWVVEIAERTASMIARWQGVGFTHGLMNTYNMSILGLTIDYGPFGFLDAFDPKFTPNTTDLPGRRYCFANQPDIGLWNLAQFTTTLAATHLINDKEANYALERYGSRFMDDYQDIMTKKLGLPKYNKQLIGKLLTNIAVDKVDYTNFFRTLSNIKADTSIPDEDLLVPLKSVLLDIGKKRKEAWTKIGDLGEVRRLLKLVEHPFDEQSRMEKCLPGFGQKFRWSEWIEDSWKCLTLLIGLRKISSVQVPGVLKTNLQLLSLKKHGLLPSSVRKLLQFVAPVSLLRLHPNHLVTGSSAATNVFLLQHGNAEVVDEAVTLSIEELVLAMLAVHQSDAIELGVLPT